MVSHTPLESKSDEELAEMTLADQEVFGLLIARYEYKIKAYIMKISSFSYEDAEDVLQEVFIKAYRNIASFDPSLKFSSWIYRIAHNHVISTFRKKKVRPEHYAIKSEDDIFQTIASELDTKKDIDIKLLRKNIEQVLANMDIKYREVLILYFFEGKTYQEISDIVRKPIPTVGTLLNRAKKLFKKQSQKLNIDLY